MTAAEVSSMFGCSVMVVVTVKDCSVVTFEEDSQVPNHPTMHCQNNSDFFSPPRIRHISELSGVLPRVLRVLQYRDFD
jgi:hypothetical protein